MSQEPLPTQDAFTTDYDSTPYQRSHHHSTGHTTIDPGPVSWQCHYHSRGHTTIGPGPVPLPCNITIRGRRELGSSIYCWRHALFTNHESSTDFQSIV